MLVFVQLCTHTLLEDLFWAFFFNASHSQLLICLKAALIVWAFFDHSQTDVSFTANNYTHGGISRRKGGEALVYLNKFFT